MKILMILEERYPPDIRIDKEASALIRQGHEVHLLCVYGKDQELAREVIQNIIVHRFDTPKGVMSKWNRGIRKLSFIDPIWYTTILKLAKEEKIDAVHVHDLPLGKTGLSCGKRLGIPVIADLHENYPVALKLWVLRWTWRDRIFNSTRRWRRHEKHILKQIDRIIVVVDEAKQRLVKEYGIEENKISVISNTVDLESLRDISEFKSNKSKAGEFIISYVGSISTHRGIDTAVATMKNVIKSVPMARLILVGGRGRVAEKIKKQIDAEDMKDYIEMVGWVSQKTALQYMVECDVGLIPHKRNEHTDSTVPHKLFQYMGMGKPVIVSDCPPLKRIVEEYQCGLVFEAGNSEALVECILSVYRNDDNYGKNGKRAVYEKYNWQKDSKTLLELYNDLKA